MTVEQKAEKYAKNLLKDVTCNIGHPRARQINSIDIEDAWLYGYKEGFKECQEEHEWHYVKDGLPTNTGLYLIFYYNSFFNDKVRCIARYSPDRKKFFNLNIEDGDEVIAWQELPAPPKEIE